MILIYFLVNTAQAFEPCRIEGYAFEINCAGFTKKTSSTSISNILKINVYQVDAMVRYPLPEPIIWIPDSIGMNVNKRAPSMISALRRVRNDRRFIWIDLNSANNEPVISCSKLSESLTDGSKLTSRIDYFHDHNFLNSCQQKLNQYDLQQFSDENIAAYYEFIRQKLGIKQVVVIAEGKGANIALAWQKISPNAIKFQVFDSPIVYTKDYPTSRAIKTQALFDEMIIKCKNNVLCHKQNPNISDGLNKIIATLPLQIQVEDTLTGQMTSILMNEELLYLSLSSILISPNRAVHLPMLLTQMHRHNWQPLIGLLSVNWAKKRSIFNDGLFLAEQCLYAKQYQHQSAINWFHATEIKRLTRLCSAIPKSTIQNSDPEIQSSAIPTLTFYGGKHPFINNDFNFLSKNTLVSVPEVGAGILGYGCAKDIVYRYAKQQTKLLGVVDDKTLDASCLVNIPFPNHAYIN